MLKRRSIIAIIIARLNSKRLKKKNILKYKNKSLIEHTFISAKKSKYLDRTIISTESRLIIKLAKRIGIEVPFIRPKSLSRDNINASKVVYHALKRIKEKYTYVLLLQPTSPFRSSIDIDKSIKKIIFNKLKSLLSVYKTKDKGKFKVKIRKKKFIERDYTSSSVKGMNYFINGAIYISEVKHFLKKKDFFSKKTGFYLMPKNKSLDIDTLDDFKKLKR